MSDSTRGFLPFDADVKSGGAYRYTDGARLSARVANERYTRMILAATDFAGKTVADIGSGDGTYTAELARRSGASSVLGIEPSPNAAGRAAEAYRDLAPRLTFRCGDSSLLLEERRGFDIAVYRGVIHHVPDAEAEFRRAVRLARTLVVLEPNGLNLMMKLVERLSPYHRSHGERSYAPGTLSRWAGAAGGGTAGLRFFGLVPYFAPAIVARIGPWCEPAVEAIPVLRRFLCGQYLLVIERIPS